MSWRTFKLVLNAWSEVIIAKLFVNQEVLHNCHLIFLIFMRKIENNNYLSTN